MFVTPCQRVFCRLEGTQRWNLTANRPERCHRRWSMQGVGFCGLCSSWIQECLHVASSMATYGYYIDMIVKWMSSGFAVLHTTKQWQGLSHLEASKGHESAVKRKHTSEPIPMHKPSTGSRHHTLAFHESLTQASLNKFGAKRITVSGSELAHCTSLYVTRCSQVVWIAAIAP